jgi:Tol biopolymer transport system component/DNA-binding winged helix-turn-helix (wHTH) protein
MVQKNVADRACFGPFEVDLHTHELWKFGTRIKLVGQPFEILSVLLSRPLELVTREELRDRLWPADTFVDFNHGLNAAVNKLRDALSDSAENPRYIETLPRRGYRFIAAIEWLPGKTSEAVSSSIPATQITQEKMPLSPVARSATEKAPGIHWRWRPFAIAAGVLCGLLLAGLGGSVAFKTVSGYAASLKTRALPEHTQPLTVAGAGQVSFSPDGNSVAYIREDVDPAQHGIFVAPAGSNQPVQLTHNDEDCWPVWSPDSRSIAFSRFENNQFSLYIVPADGGSQQKQNAEKAVGPTSVAYNLAARAERKLDTKGVVPQRGEIDWSPDGESIAFAGASGIYMLWLRDSSVHRVTEAPPASEDWGPSFSPDGQRLLFARNHQLGQPDEIWLTSPSGGEPHRVLTERGKIVGPPRWAFDGRSLIYSSDRSGHPSIWRASFEAPDSLLQIGEIGSPAWHPALSRRGYRLAYERVIKSLSIWQLDLSGSGEKHPHILVSSTSDTDQGPGPQFSPDGKKLAYMSDRAGTMEIWISNRDGSSPYQLTAVGVAGTPRWSPDSQWIAFDAHTPDGPRVLSINVSGGAPTVLTPEKFESQVPSWSRDGKWVYFGSPRSGTEEVWKVPATGGIPIQVTHHGGHAALESPDGKTLYYSKDPRPQPEIWQVPVAGGEETPVPLVRPGTWASWQVVDRGIIFVGPSLGHQAVLSFYDFAHRRTTSLAVLDKVPFWLGATFDGQVVAFDQPGQEQAQAMLIENFR